MATEEKLQPKSDAPVGQRLQQAREKAGLSTADIAAAQHLRPSVIQAIEAGDYIQIDSELFLKGYVRAYAKQVGLDADSVIAALDKELAPIRQQRKQEQEANPLADIEKRRRQKRQLGRALLLLVVLAIAGYLAVTFLVPEKANIEASSVTEPAAAPENQAETDAPASSSEPERPEPEPEPEPVTDVETPAPAATEPEPVALAQPEPVNEQIPAVVQNTDPVLENPSGLSGVAEAGRLQIQFTKDCWVRIIDADGNRLVNALQQDGDRIDVSGPAPLRVVIGAVDAVESIRFQGEPLDLSGYRAVNNRSEFTLTI